MSEYSVSCDGVALGPDGELYTLAVYTDGEGYNSHVSQLDTSVDEPTLDELLDSSLWLTAIWRTNSGALFVGDADGNVHVRRDGTWQEEQTGSDRAITSVWGLSDNEVLAVGSAGVVYMRQGQAWRPISPKFEATLYGVGGTSMRDLYACGDGGFLAHFDGDTWTRVETGTKENLNDVLALSATDAIVCGKRGTLLRGSGTSWRTLPRADADLYSIAVYRGRIFLAAGEKCVLELVDGRYVVARDTFTSYRLVANERFLASAGGETAVWSDLETWSGFDFA